MNFGLWCVGLAIAMTAGCGGGYFLVTVIVYIVKGARG